MSKEATDRYSVKVEVPITILLETIFSDDNQDVESLSRWAYKYGFIDLIKDDTTKYGYYKLQDDYNKQDFYVWLDEEERKQYDYENKLLDRIEEKDKEIERLNKDIKELLKENENKEKVIKAQDNIINKAIEYIEQHTNRLVEYLDVFEAQDLLNILQGSDNE